ncbi:histone-lysine N-methyltransferase, H3 lysine-79 specific isoform X8 [Sitodiplosis mosellana]|uniref:histone-lysine N-methyltransferase, H3 lysine-79 specific isoform X8 n=1 Tax=Sitodiplosis mosellana TaxID=263140 RepID=UPI0024442744|nr:histone-lysine N-methyltransferase, H3 lysine-79 specific isoform X8 [Sitodiplosis mosellana]
MASPGITDNKSIIKQQNSMVGSFTDASPQKQDGTRKLNAPVDTATNTLHWFAQIGHEFVENDERDNGEARDRDERLRLIKDQQNLERQKKLDELKAQAMAAQKYREQKEEERKRRIEEMRLRENDKRQQVEDRKKAIEEAERERREYIVRKNQERETRLDTKRRNERSSISFAFGSSTPRLLDPVEVNLVAPTGSYWNNRRSTSITNVSYGGGGATQLSRRSSERELSDGAKKRATSASGLDRPDDDSNDTSPFVIRSVARRKTDLIPTIPIRDSSFGSRTSLYCSTPRTQDFKIKGRAVSMTRLDQLAQPTRRKGEHVRAVIERERQQQIETNLEAERVATARKMSRSLTHLSSSSSTRSPAQLRLYQPSSASKNMSNNNNNNNNHVRPLRKSNATKSMTQLVTAKLLSTPKTTPTVVQARIAQKHANDTEIDSRTTNVSAGSRSGDVTPGGSSRPGSAMSTSTMSTSGVVRRSGGTRKPRPSSIAGTGMTPDCNESSKPQKKDRPPSRPSSAVRRSSSTTTANATKEAQAAASPKMSTSLHETPKRSVKSAPPKKTATPRGASTPKLPSPQTESATPKTVPNETPENSVEIVQTVEQVNEPIAVEEVKIVETKTVETVTTTEVVSGDGESVQSTETHEIKTEITSESEPVSNVDNIDNNKLTEPENNEMTASMIQRRVLSEHEAKAALAERRRLAREEAERQAELERQKQEEERQRELQLQAEEEEKQRQFELEAQRLVEEQRQAEEKRLQQAIEEARQREEAERLRKADEEKQRLEREEQEKKAREEAERQKIEVAERLKKEEKEREERRKRVEAIMSRTRAKTAAANNFASNTPNKAENEAGNNGVNSTESTQPSTEPAQDDETSANNTKNALGDYEKSVTDKENALIHTFSNLIENNLISTPTQQSPQHHADNNGVHKTNGKLIDFTLNDEHQPPISNGNGFSLDNKIESGIGIGNNYNDSITNQLLDLSLDTNQTAEHTVNFNNNSLITSAPLVTSDSHEAKEISLL